MFRVGVERLARLAAVEVVVYVPLLQVARERLRVAVVVLAPAAGLRPRDDNDDADDDDDDRRVVFVDDVPRRPVEVARVLDR